MIRSIIPNELKLIEYNILNGITDFNSLDGLLEKLIKNQMILGKEFNFHTVGYERTTSQPFKMYSLFEQLKNLTIKFREFLIEVKKLNL